jgi:glycosidase
MRTAIDNSLTTMGAVGAPATWVLSNHDVVRHLTRYGRPQSDGPVHDLADHLLAGPFDLELGTRRARAAALLTLALPRCAYLYQGEELGLWEVENLSDEVLQDPIWQRSGHTNRGRDGCRVPMPWSGDAPPFDFSPDHAGSAPWLPPGPRPRAAEQRSPGQRALAQRRGRLAHPMTPTRPHRLDRNPQRRCPLRAGCRAMPDTAPHRRSPKDVCGAIQGLHGAFRSRYAGMA